MPDKLSTDSSSIQVWAHEMSSSRGGLQSYTKALVHALDDLLGRPVIVHLLRERSDQPGYPHRESVRTYGAFPRWLRRPAFCIGTAAASFVAKPKLLLSAHPNLSRTGIPIARCSGARFWTAAHGIDVWEDCPASVRRALRRCDRVLAVSHFTRKALISLHGLSPARISVLPNSYDDTFYSLGDVEVSLREKYGIPRDARLLLSVGRLAEPERMKGFDSVIRAMPAILEKVPSAVYILAGRGPDRERLADLARQCGVADRVRFPGLIADNDLPPLYRLCDLFVMPSRKEGFGIVFLEALGCGRPVLAGNVDASGEPLLNGELGVLVNPDSLPEIASACIQILNKTHPNKNLYDADYLSRRAREEFGQARFKERLKDLLLAHLPSILCLRPSGAGALSYANPQCPH